MRVSSHPPPTTTEAAVVDVVGSVEPQNLDPPIKTAIEEATGEYSTADVQFSVENGVTVLADQLLTGRAC